MSAERASSPWTAAVAGGVIGSLLTAAALAFAMPGFLSSRIVRHGLLADPNILNETVEALRNAQYAPVLAANRAALETPFAVLQGVIAGILVTRFGLLAAVSYCVFRLALAVLPLPLDFGAPYATSTLVVLAVLASIAAYAFRIAIGTRAEVLDYRDFPAVAPRVQPQGKHDACFLPRNKHFTGSG